MEDKGTCALDQCKEHSGIQAKMDNIEMAMVQVMEELKTRKLTPLTTWALSIMSSVIGGMGMWILTQLKQG